MFRRGGMGAGKTEESDHLQPITQKFIHESLHLFVSSLACQIDRDKLMAKRRTNEYTRELVPCPYVCFVSTPGDAIHKESFLLTNLKDRVRKAGVRATKKLKKKLRKREEGIEMSSNLANKGTSIRMALEWPRTKKLKSTYRPIWGHDEEVYFKVRTHRQDGVPVDLSGSMLHLTLMDGRGGGDGKLIGTFTLNLAKVIEAARNPESNEHKATSALNWLSRGNTPQGASALSPDGKGRTAAMKAAQSSLRRILGHHNHTEHSDDSMKPPHPRLQQQISNGFTRVMAPLRSTKNTQKSNETGASNSHKDQTTPSIRANASNGRNESAGSSSFATTGPSDRLREAMHTNVFGSRAAKGARRSLVLRQSISEHQLQNSEQVIEFFPDGSEESPAQQQQGIRLFEDGGGVVDNQKHVSTGLVDNEDPIPKQHTSRSRLSNRRRSSVFGGSFGNRRRSSVFGSLFHKNDDSDHNHPEDDPMENMKIISIKLDEPLLRNGKEVGRITCSIDAWWMEDSYNKDHTQQNPKELKKSRKNAKK